jgi:hypothetical protein
MLDKTKKDFDDTITDLEFALKKARLIHLVEEKSRSLHHSNSREVKIRTQQEIIILKQQIKELDEQRLRDIIDH